MKQGEIWLVKYDPSVGHEFKKNRPAVILSSTDILNYSGLVTVMAITSNLSDCLSNDIEVIKDKTNNLYADSVIKVYHLSSFDKQRFIKKIGGANIAVLAKIKSYLKKHFNI
ncbi:MAG: type II toxin-antitoxin system PemK/MazF family toxin [Candidatus Komeilibacteria bacterium]|nr:type II toxin-antitoxin system PemK/MazF family toxin [Candidatus Komeilibacteria bacterium]